MKKPIVKKGLKQFTKQQIQQEEQKKLKGGNVGTQDILMP